MKISEKQLRKIIKESIENGIMNHQENDSVMIDLQKKLNVLQNEIEQINEFTEVTYPRFKEYLRNLLGKYGLWSENVSFEDCVQTYCVYVENIRQENVNFDALMKDFHVNEAIPEICEYLKIDESEIMNSLEGCAEIINEACYNMTNLLYKAFREMDFEMHARAENGGFMVKCDFYLPFDFDINVD
jgi:polyhydroxyalkanoate synthesis regulator phasin